MKVKIFYTISGIAELLKFIILTAIISTLLNFQFYLDGIVSFWLIGSYLMIPFLCFKQAKTYENIIALFLSGLKIATVITGFLFLGKVLENETFQILYGLVFFIISDFIFTVFSLIVVFIKRR